MNNETLENQTVIYELIRSLRAKKNWCGETHVQKAFFFLNELSEQKLGYDFILYKHGPYSFGLSEDLAGMGTMRFLEEEIVNPNYGPRLKCNVEVKEMLAAQFGGKAESLKPIIEFVSTNLADFGVATLERLATALFFTKCEPILEIENRARKIHEVKPHISETLALDAVNRVEGILREWEKQMA